MTTCLFLNPHVFEKLKVWTLWISDSVMEWTVVNEHKFLVGALAPSMSRLCQSLSDQELLWCWYIYKIANWKKNHFFLILTFLTSSSNANACKNLGWTLHKDFELCTKATWVDNGTVRANLSPHTQCFGSLGCLRFVKKLFTWRKDKRDSSPSIESCMCDHLSSGHSLCRENCTRFAPDFGRLCFISASCLLFYQSN